MDQNNLYDVTDLVNADAADDTEDTDGEAVCGAVEKLLIRKGNFLPFTNTSMLTLNAYENASIAGSSPGSRSSF